MPRTKKTRSDFLHDEQGRAILSTAKDMAAWVKIGFEEQDKRKSSDDPFDNNFIDLRNCVLYISYPVGSKETSSRIFNLCDMAGIVPEIEKAEDDPDYLFEVKKSIRFDGSILYGNFFHYVKFDGMVGLDDATVTGLFSCFKCHFEDFVYIQRIHLNGGFVFEQCEFNKGLVMTGAVVNDINAKFNNCVFKNRLSLAAATFVNKRIENYQQSIELTNSTVENLSISKMCADGIPFSVRNTSINGLKMNNLKHKGSIVFSSCFLDGIITSIIGPGKANNVIEELLFHSCEIKAQYHIENCDISKLGFTFGKIDNTGRLRISQCNVGELFISSSSVAGRMDILQSKISSIDLDETCVPGYLNFQANDVKQFENRQTLRLLKNEAMKVNDEVSAQYLYAEEMKSLLSDKDIPCGDKLSLGLNRLFSDFGESWFKALIVTLGLSAILTLLMLGVGSTKYMFNPSGAFIGIGAFITILLDSINVFSIPLFSETIKNYELNVFGQFIYLLIKIIVAYGSFQFIVAFRKHGRK